MKRYLFYIFFKTLLLVVYIPVSAAELQVYITGLDNNQGNIMVAVYDNKATFLKEEGRIATAILPAANAQKSRVVTTFKNFKLGNTYAIAAYHDTNSNKKLDTGLFGIPIEGYGFSNNARGFFGPPSFDKAAFLLDRKNKAINFYLSY